MTDNAIDNSTTFDRAVHGAAMFLLALIAMAHPWEVYQRIPFIGATTMKVAGALLMPLALIAWWRAGRPWLRTGAGAPIAVFAAACCFSLLFSVDPQATAFQLIIYATYVPFFIALVVFIDSSERAHRLMVLYAASTTAVAIVACICALGQLWPVAWDTASWANQRIIHEYRAGLPLRMTAAAGDFNLAALEALIALAFTLFAYPQKRTTLVRIARAIAATLLIASIAIAMSRSGLLIAAGLVLASPIRTRRGLVGAAVLGLVLGLIATAILAWVDLPFVEVTRDRLLGGITHDDGSVRGRMDVYRIGLSIVPQYIITGCGLGAIDTAMAMTPDKDNVVMTLHSTTLKILIETGIIGFVAFIWLCIAAIRSAMRSEATPTARPFIAALVAGLAMTAVQPFPMLSLYPFVFALAFGPVTRMTHPASRVANPIAPTIAAAILVAFVTFNIAAMQRAAQSYEQYADAIETGGQSVERGDMSAAIVHYTRAIQLAEGMAEAMPYRQEAERLLQTKLLYHDMAIPASRPMPVATSRFLRGRALLAIGNWDEAEADLIEAIEREGQFIHAHYALAEAAWRIGRYREALEYYGRTPMPTARTGKPSLQDAAALRRGGNWAEALAMYEELSKEPDAYAEVWFNLGVGAELDGDVAAARKMYERALGTDPTHIGAITRMDLLP